MLYKDLMVGFVNEGLPCASTCTDRELTHSPLSHHAIRARHSEGQKDYLFNRDILTLLSTFTKGGLTAGQGWRERGQGELQSPSSEKKVISVNDPYQKSFAN